jgi:hypothetical protein
MSHTPRSVTHRQANKAARNSPATQRMPDRILIVERDAEDPAVWRYGLADGGGELGDRVFQIRHDSPDDWTPLGDRHGDLFWTTAILLIRPAGEQTRIVYDLTLKPVEAPEPPPRPSGARWERSTSGKAKGAGETLRQKAERPRDGRPRAAA